ncbi:TPA: acyltransferase family protein [Klebsiella pneumoniae]
MNIDFLAKRNVGLDFFRAIIILEGVLYHASRSLPNGEYWYYLSPRQTPEIFVSLMYLIHSFRMEVFFFISGLFSALILERKGNSFFLRNRLKRVLIPLISAFLFIPGVMYIISLEISGGEVDLNNLFASYFYVHHLWFLISLSAMSFLVPVKFNFMVAKLSRRLSLPSIIILMFFLGNSIFFIKYLLKDANPSLSIIPVTLRFFVYYLAGFSLYVNRDKVTKYKQCKLMNAFTTLTISIIVMALFYIVIHYKIEGVAKYIPVIISGFLSATLSFWVVFFFEEMKIKPNKFINGIINSALVIYIIHYPAVVSLSYFLDKIIPKEASITYVFSNCAISILISFSFYLIIRKKPVLSAMFGLSEAQRNSK